MDLKREILKKKLPCELDLSEIQRKHNLILYADVSKECFERDIDGYKIQIKILKEQCKEKDDVIRRTRREIEAGEEERTVDVEKVINFDTNLVTFTRLDTGEIIEDRPLNEEEKQVGLLR